MPKILITGSNGLLGEHLVQKFKNKKDWELVATARGENRLMNKTGYRFRILDICDPEQVEDVLLDEHPDYVIHAAAMTQVDGCEEDKNTCWDTNVIATQWLVKAARKVKAYFIFISTDFIFDGAKGPYSEKELPNPLNYYGVSKLAAEMFLEGADIASTTLRTVLVYGVSENKARSNIVLWVKKSLEAGKQIHVVDDQWRTPTLVDDLAEGCRLVIVKKEKGEAPERVYNISGKEVVTPYEIALEVADYFELDQSLITRADASTFSQKAKRPAKTGFLLNRAEQELNYRPHSLQQGLRVVKEKLEG